jgi:hypothetical protein
VKEDGVKLWRCPCCKTVIALEASEIDGNDFELRESGELYVNHCRVCDHYRHYEELPPLPNQR